MKSSLVGIALVALSAASAFAEVTANVTQVKQNWPWSRDVAVTFTLSGATEPMDIDVTLSSNGKSVQMPFGSVFGEATSLTNGTYTLKIDPTKTEFARERLLTDAQVSLTPVTERLYMVVDLTAGLDNLTPASVSFRNTVDGTGTQWSDTYKSDKLVLKRVKATSFTMGNTVARSGYGHEYPQRQVVLTRDYYLGVYELTLAQYKKLGGGWPLKSSDSYFKADEPFRPAHCLRYNTLRGYTYTSIPPTPGSKLDTFGKKTGYGFDYPTEAQWENAAHAGVPGERYDGTVGTFSDAEWNAGIDSTGYLNTIARNLNNAVTTTDRTVTADEGGLARVGTYAPNAWGFYDMIGNVGEWVRDSYNGGSYGDTPAVDPYDHGENKNKIVRGGSFDGGINTCRVTYRRTVDPGQAYTYLGARLCVTVE